MTKGIKMVLVIALISAVFIGTFVIISKPKDGYCTFNQTSSGKFYSIVLETDDEVPIGEIFDTEEKLRHSPIGLMYKKAFIIKADDLRDPIHKGFKRFKELIEECNAKATLGIVTCHIGKTAEGTEWLRNLDKNRFELFHHGWDHFISRQYNSAEFKNTGYKHQFTHLAMGIEAAKKHLGYTFHTFGAPGSAIDLDTQKSILANPDIKVWLNGTNDRKNRYLALKRNMELEERTGRMKNADGLIKEYQSRKDYEVITTQIHPKVWDEADLFNLKGLLEYINTDPERRFFTPYEYYHWINDRNKIVLWKSAPKEYMLNMSNLKYPHLIEFNIRGTQY